MPLLGRWFSVDDVELYLSPVFQKWSFWEIIQPGVVMGTTLPSTVLKIHESLTMLRRENAINNNNIWLGRQLVI